MINLRVDRRTAELLQRALQDSGDKAISDSLDLDLPDSERLKYANQAYYWRSMERLVARQIKRINR